MGGGGRGPGQHGGAASPRGTGAGLDGQTAHCTPPQGRQRHMPRAGTSPREFFRLASWVHGWWWRRQRQPSGCAPAAAGTGKIGRWGGAPPGSCPAAACVSTGKAPGGLQPSTHKPPCSRLPCERGAGHALGGGCGVGPSRASTHPGAAAAVGAAASQPAGRPARPSSALERHPLRQQQLCQLSAAQPSYPAAAGRRQSSGRLQAPLGLAGGRARGGGASGLGHHVAAGAHERVLGRAACQLLHGGGGPPACLRGSQAHTGA